SAYPLLMFLLSLDAVQEEIAAGRALPTRSTTGAAVLFPDISEDFWHGLHDAGLCLSCSPADDQDVSKYACFDFTRCGLFTYTHLAGNGIAGPYGRERLPTHPLHIDQLPPALRNAIKATTFDALSFAEVSHIQPASHFSCCSTEKEWLDLD